MDEALPELFPGFERHSIKTELGNIFCRTGGSGPALLLVHGYPQSHVIWHKIAPELAKHFFLVLPDLPGYGQSDVPALSADHASYTKRSMAAALVEVMRTLGHDRFRAAGHDRGGRVVYRMALDQPQSLKSAAVLDILPTYDYWNRMDRSFALKIYHWAFLAQPAPFPEKMIADDPIGYLHHTLASWTAKKDLSAFSDGAMIHNRAWFKDPVRIAATCEDYRAGAFADFDHDAADRTNGTKIQVPLLALWGARGIAASVDDPLAIWRQWCSNAEGRSVDAGHFLPEEAPEATGDALKDYFLS